MIDLCLRDIDGHNGSVNVVKFTVDGNYCMTGSDDRTIKLWNPHKYDPSSGQNSTLMIKSYDGAHGYSILDLAISKDKTRFSSCGEDRTCFVWDVTTGQTIRRIQAHNHRINAVAYNDEATVLITASYDQTAKCWDMRSNNRDPIQVMSDFKDSVSCVARTDTTIIIGSIDGFVRVYDLRKGQLQCDNLMHPVTSVQVSEDQNCYVSACLDNTVRLCEVASGVLLKEYVGHEHASFKGDAAFQSDHNHIIAGSEDGTVVHWSLVSGLRVRAGTQKGGAGIRGTADSTGRGEMATSCHSHGKAISSLAYHPSKPLFITASYDGTAKVWENVV
jgi:mitogen-activated protein kinase organizer 1